MMDAKKIYEDFLKLEDELGLFGERVGNVLFWERVRFGIYHQLVLSKVGVSVRSETRPRSKLNYYVSAIINIIRNPFLVRAKKILFVGTPRRILRPDGHWWDVYTDPIIRRLSEPSLSLEYSFQFNHSNPPRTKNLRYLDFIEFLSHLRQTLGLSKVKLSKQEDRLLIQIREEISIRFGVDINIKNRVVLTLEKRKARLPLYQFLLRHIRTQIAIIAVSYGKEDFIEACKSMRIPVAELQHGIIHRYHLAYSYEGETRRKFTFPDYFLSFGDYWSRRIDYPVENKNVIPVGYPLIDEKRLKYKNVQKKKQVIFISQPQSGASLSKIALELSKDKDLQYKIVYKLHSEERKNWRKSYPWLVDSDVQVIDTTKDILHKLLAESEVQIGVGSTAIYEGLAFGLRTYLMDGPGIDYFDSLIESGTALMIDSVDNLKQKIMDPKKQTPIDIEFFFKSGAAIAIVDFVKQFIV